MIECDYYQTQQIVGVNRMSPKTGFFPAAVFPSTLCLKEAAMLDFNRPHVIDRVLHRGFNAS